MRATERTEHCLKQQSWSRAQEVPVLVPSSRPDRRDPQGTDHLALASDLGGGGEAGGRTADTTEPSVGYFCWVVRKGCLRTWHWFQDVNPVKGLVRRKPWTERLEKAEPHRGWDVGTVDLNVLDGAEWRCDPSREFGFST